jgi:hypothetical protein
MSASLTDRVSQIAESLANEDSKPLSERDILEIKYQVTESGSVQEVTTVLTVGGPHIEVECLRGVVAGQWSGETFRRGFESEDVEEYGRMLATRMESRID